LRPFAAKLLLKTKNFLNLQCKDPDAKVAGGNGFLTNDQRLVAWIGVGKILFAPWRLFNRL